MNLPISAKVTTVTEIRKGLCDTLAYSPESRVVVTATLVFAPHWVNRLQHSVDRQIWSCFPVKYELTNQVPNIDFKMKMMTSNSCDKHGTPTMQARYKGASNFDGDVSASTQSMTEGDSESSEEEPMSPPQFPCFVTIQSSKVAFDDSCLFETSINDRDNKSNPPDLDDSDDDASFAPLEDDDEPPEADFHSFADCTRPTDPSTNVTIDSVSPQSQVHYSADTQPKVDNDHFNEDNFVQPKTLPGLSNSHKMVCVSFLEPHVATAVACQVLDESYRMLRPGGLLYVIDKGGCTVRKHPTMFQWLTRVRDPTVKHFIYEIETRAILQANGLGHATLDENHQNGAADDASSWGNDDIVRWVGIKP